MKDNIEIDCLTKFDSFRLNIDQVMDLEQTSLILKLRPPKPYKLLKNIIQFSDNCKVLSSTYYLEITEVKINMFSNF